MEEGIYGGGYVWRAFVPERVNQYMLLSSLHHTSNGKLILGKKGNKTEWEFQ